MDEEIRYGASLVTRPPRPGDRPALTEADALAIADGFGFGGTKTQGQRNVVLRRIDWTICGWTEPEGLSGVAEETRIAVGAHGRPHSDVLAWVIEYPESRPIVHGPMTMSDEARREIEASLVCSFMIVLDATTGECIDSTQYCRGAAYPRSGAPHLGGS